MFRKEELQEFRDRERRKAESYLSIYVDFVKWTTVLALAAVAWLGSSIKDQAAWGLALIIAAFIAVAASLILAVIALKAVLELSGHEWEMARLHHSLALLDLFKSLDATQEFVDDKSKELQGRFQELSKTGDKFQGTDRFNRLVTCHTGALVTGVILYAIAQLVGALVR
jgi:hypothetical protein